MKAWNKLLRQLLYRAAFLLIDLDLLRIVAGVVQLNNLVHKLTLLAGVVPPFLALPHKYLYLLVVQFDQQAEFLQVVKLKHTETLIRVRIDEQFGCELFFNMILLSLIVFA